MSVKGVLQTNYLDHIKEEKNYNSEDNHTKDNNMQDNCIENDYTTDN